jgi:predicted signal transduction protein with EAL and GGDEF domain
MNRFLLLDRDTNSAFTEIRNFQIRLLKILIGIGLFGILIIWLRDIWVLNNINLFESIAYPSLITLLSASLLILCFWQKSYPIAALISVGSFATYYLFHLQTIIFANQSTQEINIVIQTTQWFPLIYINAFIFLKRHQAIVISILMYSLLIAAIVTKFFCGINPANSSHIFSILMQILCCHPIYVVALLWIILIQNHLTQAIAQINSMRTIANLDYLTGIPNRRAINETLQQRLTQAKNTDKKIATILVDIDYFKTINDHYGHDIGDQVLIVFSNILRENVGVVKNF